MLQVLAALIDRTLKWHPKMSILHQTLLCIISVKEFCRYSSSPKSVDFTIWRLFAWDGGNHMGPSKAEISPSGSKRDLQSKKWWCKRNSLLLRLRRPQGRDLWMACRKWDWSLFDSQQDSGDHSLLSRKQILSTTRGSLEIQFSLVRTPEENSVGWHLDFNSIRRSVEDPVKIWWISDPRNLRDNDFFFTLSH